MVGRHHTTRGAALRTLQAGFFRIAFSNIIKRIKGGRVRKADYISRGREELRPSVPAGSRGANAG